MLHFSPRHLARPLPRVHFTQVQKQGADGKIDNFVKINWNDVAAENNGYGVRVTIDGDARYYRADDSKFLIPVKAPETVQVEVRTRATDGGTPSAWSAPQTINVTKKGTGPAKATGLTVKRRPKANRLKWDRCTDTDFKETAVLRRVSTSDPWVEIDRTAGTSYLDDDENLAKGTNYKYKIVHYNRSDNPAVDSDQADNTVEFIGTSDTDAATLAAPTGISLIQANRDVNADGTVDTALRSTFSGGVAGAAGYEIWWEDSAGQSATARADSGSFWFMANTTRSYRVRWRTINWVGTPGAWSSYSSYVTPSPTTGAPAAPTGVASVSVSGGWVVNWTQPSELDYSHTEIALDVASPTYIIASAIGNKATIFYPAAPASTLYLRHANTSGLRSGWVGGSLTPGTTFIRPADIDSNVAYGAKTAIGSSNSGSVNPLAGSSGALVSVSFKCTSTTAGVTLTLNGTSRVVDFTDQRIVDWTEYFAGAGPYTFSKSGGGTYADCSLSAIAIK